VTTEENFKHYIETDPDGMFVKAWSTDYLRFNKVPPAQRRFKNELGEAIEGLNSSGILHAIYISQCVKPRTDVENIVLYNVGPAKFKRVANDIFRFERRSESIPNTPTSLNFHPLHYYEYKAEDRETKFRYAGGHKIAQCPQVICREIKAVNVWRSIKSKLVSKAGAILLPGSHFAVQLTIRDSGHHKLPNIVKPMLDGFISALHYNDNLHNDVVDRVAKMLGASTDETRTLLIDSSNALLGARAVPNLYPPNGLQWSPADDHLIAGEIIREATPAGTETEISGCLFTAAGTIANENIKRGLNNLDG
jgi:hypothetical protein